MDDWNTRFLLGWPTFRGYVKGGYRIWTFVGSSFHLNKTGLGLKHTKCVKPTGVDMGDQKKEHSTLRIRNPPQNWLVIDPKKQPPLLKNRFKLTLPLEAPLIILKVNSCSPCIYPRKLTYHLKIDGWKTIRSF